MDIVEQVKNEVMKHVDDFKKTDDYDFWGEHIQLVFDHALKLADLYNADKEIVALGALLHDIALIDRVGARKEHHVNGAKIAADILSKFGYEKAKTKQVENCVLHHRNSKAAENINETCVADADILAHFSNVPMVFQGAFKEYKSLSKARAALIDYFKKDFNDLSAKTQKTFKPQFDNIMNVLFPDAQA